MKQIVVAGAHVLLSPLILLTEALSGSVSAVLLTGFFSMIGALIAFQPGISISSAFFLTYAVIASFDLVDELSRWCDQ